MKKFIVLIPLLVACAFALAAQSQPFDTAGVAGAAWARMEIENGDTTYVMALRMVRITDRRIFKSRDEQNQYYRYRIAAGKVYPYAVQAINLYNEIMAETKDMKKGKRKRYIRSEHHELKDEFEDRLKGLSRTQGRVLIKMIERQVGKPFYEVIRETRGGMTAVYWHNLGKLWDYDLKQGYQLGADTLLDEVLLDYDFGDSVYKY